MEELGERKPLVLPEDDNDASTSLTKPRRLIIIEPVVLLYFMAYVPMIPLTEQYLYYKVGQLHNYTMGEYNAGNASECGGLVNKSDPAYILLQTVQAESSMFLLYFTLVQTVPALFTTIFFGALSDNLGRKIAMLVPICGNVLRSITFLVIIHFELHPYWTFLAAVFEGLSGSIGAALMACFSYLIDITTHKQRSFRITVLDSMIGISGAMASLGVGYWIKAQGFFYPYILCTSLQTLNLLYVSCFVPETVTRNPDIPIVSCSHFTNVAKVYRTGGEKYRQVRLILLLIVLFICGMPLISSSVVTLYLLNTPLCLGPVMLGIYSSIWLIVRYVGSVIAVKLFSRWLQDTGLVILGCFSFIGYLLITAFATNNIVLFIGPAVGVFASLIIPMVRSIMSKLILPKMQGSLFASIACMETLSVLVGSSIFNPIYQHTLNFMRGFVFIIETSMVFIGLLLTVLYIYLTRKVVKAKTSNQDR
ncbi:unnamed protein product [Owenia fusiformis]|nr:unnamed protein product [Owenia fusiformis]